MQYCCTPFDIGYIAEVIPCYLLCLCVEVATNTLYYSIQNDLVACHNVHLMKALDKKYTLNDRRLVKTKSQSGITK